MSRTFLLVGASLALGALVSWIKLALTCRRPDSEQCVWGKAYNGISWPIETVVFGIVIFLVLRVALRRR